ncbi:MAG TPA: chemotaxis protein CheV [Clostridiales bacterium]|nr:MAG: hypothetical protein A2Y18_05745 [Clostridiales bacterium GWD2_32_19]HCC06777.1 chemotaxis protein CheV [Clostridiales bacterium]
MSKSDILLESGTNEFEIVEFTVGNSYFGINVAKVHQVIQHADVSVIPNSEPALEGVFDLRGEHIVPLINLATYLHLPQPITDSTDKIIITEFNNTFTAFHVESVATIHRVSWSSVEAPDAVTHSHGSVVIGVIRMQDKIVLLIDFEKILMELSPRSGLEELNNERALSDNNSLKKIFVVEDSEFLRIKLIDVLHKAGYANTTEFTNGLDAWEYISDSDSITPSLIITDIEMPSMDGHHLITKIRNESPISEVPIIIFSSLITDEMYKKGKELGASEQVSKPQINTLITVIDSFIK